jgi:hypothetical protein
VLHHFSKWMVRLWDAATGAALQTLEGFRDVRTLSFSVDGSHLQTDRVLFGFILMPAMFFLSQLIRPNYL